MLEKGKKGKREKWKERFILGKEDRESDEKNNEKEKFKYDKGKEKGKKKRKSLNISLVKRKKGRKGKIKERFILGKM